MGLKDTLRIMVVDDMSVSRGLLVQSLEEMGLWKNETEASGPAALARLTARPCHLVLCDYNMPGMDGLGLLHALRSHRATQGIGFILVTGHPHAPDAREGAGAPAQQPRQEALHHAEPQAGDRERGRPAVTAGDLLARMAAELEDLGAGADELGASLARGAGVNGLQALDLLRQRAEGLAVCARVLAENASGVVRADGLEGRLPLASQRRRLLGEAAEVVEPQGPELF